MEHTMWLDDEPFSKILDGKKTIELRLNDEKRQKIQVGDIIFFKNRKTKKRICVTCKKLHYAKSFKELFEQTSDHSVFGLEYQYGLQKMVSIMRNYYSESDEITYGIVGIEFDGPTNCVKEHESFIEELFAEDYMSIRHQADAYGFSKEISIVKIFDKIIEAILQKKASSCYAEEHMELSNYFKMIYFYAKTHNYQDICRMLSNITTAEYSRATYHYQVEPLRHLSHATFSENIDGNRYSKDELPLCWRDFFDKFSILKYMCIIYDDRIDEPWYYLVGKD